MLPYGRVDDLVASGNRKAKVGVRKAKRSMSVDTPIWTATLPCRPSLLPDFLPEASDLLDDELLHALELVLFLEAKVEFLQMKDKLSCNQRP